MTDTAPTNDQTVQSTQDSPTDAPANPESTNSANPGEVKLEDLPESWQKTIKDLRSESAKYRTRAGTLETQLNDSRTEWTNKEAEITGQVSDASLELARYRAAALSGVPADRIDDFASRLRGSSAEELEQDAAHLAEMFGAGAPSPRNRGVDPSQGRGNDSSTPSTPDSEFANSLKSQLSNLFNSR